MISSILSPKPWLCPSSSCFSAMEEEKQDEPTIPNTKNQTIICEECKINASKYKCPGCSLRSCSLPCVNAHKQRTSCTGKRPLADAIPLSQFNDDLLLSDYSMLEDVKRIAESAQRTRAKLCGYSHFRLPFPLKSLRSAAARRRTKILFHSNGMSKRETNRTFYNNRKKFISWTIEWRFHLTNVVLVDHGVHENRPLSSVIENHLKPGPWNHSLKQFCDEALDSLKFFIRKYPKGPRSPFRQLNIKAPIQEQLMNMVILEFPVIYVFLPTHSYDFEVINDSIPIKESLHNEPPSPKGVTFREEEIEDGGSSDPHVSDLMNHLYKNREAKKETKESMQSPLAITGVKRAKSVSRSDTCMRTAEDNNGGSNSRIKQLADCDDIDFELEPGLLDAYSNFIAETNIENLLDFDAELADEHKNLEIENFLMEEELEEGEIA